MKYAGVKLWKDMNTLLWTPEGKRSYRNQQEEQFPSLGVPSPLCILELSWQIHIEWQSKQGFSVCTNVL